MSSDCLCRSWWGQNILEAPIDLNKPNLTDEIPNEARPLSSWNTDSFSCSCGPGNVVVIMTGYGLDGLASNPGGGEIFRTCPDRPWVPPSLLYNGYRVFPGSNERPRSDADHSPPFSAAVKKEYSYTSTVPVGRTACTEPQCLYKGALYLYLL